MSDDPEWKAPSNFREFLRDKTGMVRTIKYVFALADSPDVRPGLYMKYAIATVMVLISMSQPKLVAIAFQGVVTRKVSLATLGVFGLIGLMLFRGLWSFIYFRAHEQLFGRCLRNIHVRIAAAFFSKSPGQHRHIKSLNYESIQKGKGRVGDIYINHLPELFSVVMTIIIAYALIWTVSPFGGAVLGGAMLIYGAWSVYLNYRVVVICTPIERDFSKYERYFAEVFKLFERVYSSNKKEYELDRVRDKWWDVAVRDRVFWTSHGTKVSIAEAFMAIVIGIVLYHETLRAIALGGAITTLVPLFAWSAQIASDLWRIRHIERLIYNGVPSIEVMREILTVPCDVVDAKHARDLIPSGPLTLRFDAVTYWYPNSEDTLTNVSLEVRPGEKVALVGRTGAGKSTIEYLALRFMDPSLGKVLIDGVDLREYRLSTVLDAIGYIPQKPLTFDGTVRDNLLYGLPANERKRWSDEKIVELMRDLAIDFGIRPAGENPLDIVVGRDGIQLSGGQAQRLTIGSAIIKRPRLLIIDEATSALDSATETKVLEGLRKWIDGSGMLVIAHRLSTVKDADRIVVLEKGRVEAVGTSFEELAATSFIFQKIISGQDHLLREIV